MEVSKKIGLVLSGGGFRGVAHVGVIQALEEASMIPKYVSGSSAGAIVGALYAGGYSVKDIKEFFSKTSLFEFKKFTRKKPGLLDSEKFSENLTTFFPDNSFETLQKKLFVTTTNLVTGTAKVFSSGRLIEPILASAAFPGIFSPIMINEELYADGGILDNFPTLPIKKHCDIVIGVNLTPTKKPNISDFKYSHDVIQRAFFLRALANSASKFKDCDLFIQPQGLANYRFFSNSHLEEEYDLGYQEAKKQLKLYFDKTKL